MLLLRHVSLLPVSLFACGSLDLPSGVIQCSTKGDCPSTMSCWSDGICRELAEPDASPADGPVPDGGERLSLRIQAEAYDVNDSLDATYSWQLASEITGSEGDGYMEAVPDADAYCDGAPPTDCGAVLRYQFEVCAQDSCDLPAGTYFVHVRGYSNNNKQDSLYLGLDGALVGIVDMPDNETYWTWTRAPEAIDVVEGTRELFVWMREDGAHVDAFDVSMSAEQPD